MYKKIINPNTGKALNIDQPGGIKILKKYLEVIDIQNGGDDKYKKNNDKYKKNNDTGIEKEINKKGSELINELIDGPKDVANFFGTKIKSSFSGLFGWNRKYPKKNLTSLDKRMIKNIFDSDESDDADKKFASSKSAQLAADSGYTLEEIVIALFVLQRERTSDRGWTKMEVEMGIKYIESWNNTHKKQWSEKIKEIKKKLKKLKKVKKKLK